MSPVIDIASGEDNAMLADSLAWASGCQGS
jgi:hypothetical protein